MPCTAALPYALSHCQGGNFANSIALVTVPAFLPTSLVSLLFNCDYSHCDPHEAAVVAQKSPLLSLLPQASQEQASQTASRMRWERLASLHEANFRHKLVTAISRGREHPSPIISPTVLKTSSSFWSSHCIERGQ